MNPKQSRTPTSVETIILFKRMKQTMHGIIHDHDGGGGADNGGDDILSNVWPSLE
jgi:hypothetical protein